jgi:hypothetical protein
MEWNTPNSNTLVILFVYMWIVAGFGLYTMHNGGIQWPPPWHTQSTCLQGEQLAR